MGPGRLSCQISANQREEETSSNVTNIERHVQRVMTSLLMSSPPISISHRKSSMHIFNFHRRSCQLYFLFPPRRQSAPESLLAGKQSKGILRSRGVIQQRERYAFWWTPEFVSVELFKVKTNICLNKEFWKFSKVTAKPKVMENLKSQLEREIKRLRLRLSCSTQLSTSRFNIPT